MALRSLVLLLLLSLLSCNRIDWPPRVGELYPDLSLISHSGQKMKLSDLKGKVILLEPVGMSCAGCQAFSGGNTVGGFGGVEPQKGLGSLDELVKKHAWGVSLRDERLVVVQLLIFDPKMEMPTPEAARVWAEHFKVADRKNWYVTVSETDLRKGGYELIPGFQLIDKQFKLRFDSTGQNQRDNLFETTLPNIAKLLQEKL